MSQKVDLYLHIGFGKTGTTSIQDCFNNNRAALGKMGFLYPKAGLRGTGHHNLAILGPEGLTDKVKKELSLLQREINNSSHHKVFISSEFFPWLKHDYVQYLKDLFSAYNTTVIIYVRNQLELISSAFLQWQKVGDNYRGSIEAFFGPSANSFNYMNRIAPYVSAFGKDAILARVYDKRIVGNDVRNDILRVIGIDADLDFSAGHSNISLLPEFSPLVSMLDEGGVSIEMRKLVVNKLLELSQKFKPLSSENLIDSSLEQKIFNQYRESNREFAKLFLDEEQSEIFLQKVNHD